MEFEAYVGGLTLGDALPPHDKLRTRGAADIAPKDMQGAVDVGSVLSFVDGVRPEEREDVLYSVQLAQRAASGKFDRHAEIEKWYNAYVDVLQGLGWVVEKFVFARHDQSEGELKMDESALSIVASAATGGMLTVLTAAITALRGLADKDHAIGLFERFAAADESGNFQLGAVERSDNGAMAMALGAFYYKSRDRRRKFLFWTWGANDVDFWTSAQKLTLNTGFYARGRAAVIAKLGDPADYVADLGPLG